jgi:uncharacterized protein YyaL (SSP411 family)
MANACHDNRTLRYRVAVTVGAMPNALSESSSPYLLQHADNPVDWREWSQDAFDDARRRDVPVLLSVGYATCHWCHVMAHESFEDETTAGVMNESFVNVKVDREERPDVDRIYMDAVQATTGRGGWPMTVFLTPEAEPFFAGTYFPPEPRAGYPSFRQVMESVVDAWRDHRGDIREQAGRLTQAVRTTIPPAETDAGIDTIARAVDTLASSFDWEHGGFGGAPKFPQPSDLELLVRVLALDLLPERSTRVRAMLTTTLDAMAAGGIHDQLAGGFSRYSVDRRWLVPHFEKMLDDNALLARLYLRVWQVTGVEDYRRVAVSTVDYLLSDLADPGGGFHSGEDADSEGEEGRFYVWSWDELETVAGADLELVALVFGASRNGNFDGGRNVLTRARPIHEAAERFGLDPADAADRIERVRAALLTRRTGRVRPSVDDKVVTAWNGLTLRTLAETGAVLGEPRYLEAARRLAHFAVDHLVDPGGRLVRTWRNGVAGPPGFCDDHAAMAVGMFALYQATGEIRWYREAERLTRSGIELFADPDGGFFATAHDAEQLIARPKNLMDNPTPSDNSLMAEALQTLASYTGDPELTVLIDGVRRAAGTLIGRHPGAVGHLLAVMAAGIDGVREIAVVGEDPARRTLVDVVWDEFRPDTVVAWGPAEDGVIPLLDGRTVEAGAVGSSTTGTATAYVCRRFVCDLPVGEPDALRRKLTRTP